jgi:hypothetical protein
MYCVRFGSVTSEHIAKLAGITITDMEVTKQGYVPYISRVYAAAVPRAHQFRQSTIAHCQCKRAGILPQAFRELERAS